jgi:hypothetical protein
VTPRRTIKGSTWEKGPTFYWGFPLREEDRARSGKKRFVGIVPELPGTPYNKAYAERYKNAWVFKYEHRQWNPLEDKPAAAPGEVPTVREYGTRWAERLTNANAPGDRKWFKDFITGADIGRMKLDEVRARHVKMFVDGLKLRPAVRGGTIAPRTIRNVYSVLQRIFGAATFEELIPASPCRLPRGVLPKIVDKDPLARRTWIREWADVEKLLADPRVPPDRRVLYALEHLTGARFSEIAATRWLAWEPKRKPLGCLSIAYSRDLNTGLDKSVKTEIPREVPVHPRLAKILHAWQARGWAEHYGRAPTPEDRIVPGRGFASRDPRNNWTRHAEDCKKLWIRRTRQHDARRTFISALRDADVRPDVVGMITHGREPTVQGSYTEIAWSKLCAAVEKLPIKASAKVR